MVYKCVKCGNCLDSKSTKYKFDYNTLTIKTTHNDITQANCYGKLLPQYG